MSRENWPTLAGIERAAETVRSHLAQTPLVRSELLSAALAADVWLKNETVTPIASFKIRGALNAITQARAAGIEDPGYSWISSSRFPSGSRK